MSDPSTPLLFGPVAHKVPAGPPVTHIPVSAFPEALAGPRPSRALVASVAEFGVVAPVIIKEDEAGSVVFRANRYTLVDGNRRVMAARAAGCERVPARVLPDFGESAALTLALNGLRQDNPITEYLAITAMLARGLSESDITRESGFPSSTIRARLQLGRLNAALFDALSAQRITASVAEAAAKLGPELQARLVEQLRAAEKLTAADVRAVRQVEVEEALDDLPFEVFEPVEDVDAWRGVVVAELQRAIALMPTGRTDRSARDARKAIERAITLIAPEAALGKTA